MMLDNDTLSAFMKEDWRRRPRLFRGAIDVSRYPLDPEALCELTADDFVESRLINEDYTVTDGPFEFVPEPDIALLGDGQMLMVQCLEQHFDTVNLLLDHEFDFMPRWQIDDVMGSFGYDGANCGAHFDHYDVFLLQLSGSKRWHLDQSDHDNADLSPHLALRLLEKFEPTETLNAEPGDVLYIPPGVGHYGVCEGESLTLSVGVRHPATDEILTDIAYFAMDKTTGHSVTTGLAVPGQGLDASDIDLFRAEITNILDRSTYTRWYGCYVTRLRDPSVLEAEPQPDQLNGAVIGMTRASRCTWFLEGTLPLMFINGDCHEIDPDLEALDYRTLCEHRRLTLPDRLPAPVEALIRQLIDSGALCLEALPPGVH